jgi:hypothetical protein
MCEILNANNFEQHRLIIDQLGDGILNVIWTNKHIKLAVSVN